MHGIESFSNDARCEKESLNVSNFSETDTKVTMDYWMLRQEITSLVHQPKEEKSKHSRQEEEITKVVKMLKSLEEVLKTSTSQAAFTNLLEG